MKHAKHDKTNAARLLEQKKVDFSYHTYEADATASGAKIAEMLGKDPDRIFKTLVTEGKSGENYVFVIPVSGELDLKKAAAAVGEKSVSMLKQRDLLSKTGYVHGGCSPIGMKKFFRTTFDATLYDGGTVSFNAGKVGHMLELAPSEIEKVIRFKTADLTK
jgi:Cys-tRNA(Pro)/Cys-tRNA(Cys) deacylase